MKTQYKPNKPQRAPRISQIWCGGLGMCVPRPSRWKFMHLLITYLYAKADFDSKIGDALETVKVDINQPQAVI